MLIPLPKMEVSRYYTNSTDKAIKSFNQKYIIENDLIKKLVLILLNLLIFIDYNYIFYLHIIYTYI